MAERPERTFRLSVHSEDDGTFWAQVLDLPGCFASGNTIDELIEALEEAVSLYLLDKPSGVTIADPTALLEFAAESEGRVGEATLCVA